MNVKILEKRGDWDASPYTIEGVGTGFVLRPHPNAGGGAHPRYMGRTGFISLSPRLGLDPDKFFDELPQTFVCELRETKRGETFLAVLSVSKKRPTHVGFFSTAYSVRGRGGTVLTIADSEDRTASSATRAHLGFYIAQVGALIEEGDDDGDPIIYRAAEDGLTVLSADEGITAEDLEILG